MATESLPTHYYVADFETTVYDGQAATQVWAAAIVEMYTEEVQLTKSIESFMAYVFFLSDIMTSHLVIYFHNLKFDGSFILYYLLSQEKYKQALMPDGKTWKRFNKMLDNEYSYVISDKGQWYKLTIKYKGRRIEFRDSAKLVPFSVATIGESFGTKHRKLSMAYEGYREPNGYISPEEEEYIKNDVLVVKEALEIMYNEGNTRLTIGSCCLAQFKAIYSKESYDRLFPNVYKIPLQKSVYKYDSVGTFIMKSYHGAWCYLAKGKERKRYSNGCTYDVNSLYPYVMHSASGFDYPIGKPVFWTGNFIPTEAMQEHRYYFVWFRSRFYLKPGKLPTIQIKFNPLYNGKEWLETSDVRLKDHYYRQYIDVNGVKREAIPEFIMTQWDWKLLHEHYNLEDTVIYGGCYFISQSGLFDAYIDHYKEIKMHNKGAKRTEAKLFSNNLYGKMAASPDSSYRVAHINEEQVLRYDSVEANDKIPGYIPIGSAITSHARYYTITHAQKNYHGPDKPGFIYADTDSLHGDMPPEDWIDIETDPAEYGKWKCEAEWDEATFVMAKTYIEHVIRSDGKRVRPHYNVTAAGMPKECKTYLQRSLDGIKVAKREKQRMAKDVQKFINTPRTDFKPGLVILGALKATNFPGGILLKARPHTVR